MDHGFFWTDTLYLYCSQALDVRSPVLLLYSHIAHARRPAHPPARAPPGARPPACACCRRAARCRADGRAPCCSAPHPHGRSGRSRCRRPCRTYSRRWRRRPPPMFSRDSSGRRFLVGGHHGCRGHLFIHGWDGCHRAARPPAAAAAACHLYGVWPFLVRTRTWTAAFPDLPAGAGARPHSRMVLRSRVGRKVPRRRVPPSPACLLPLHTHPDGWFFMSGVR